MKSDIINKIKVGQKSMHFGKHSKIGIGWAFCVTLGFYSFYLSKKSIDARRYENMKIRDRMRQANVGDYEESYRGGKI